MTEYVKNTHPNYPFYPINPLEGCIYNEEGQCIISDYLSHTTTIETAQKIISDGQLLSAERAFNLSGEELVNDSRNAAGDPADYFQYVMFAWSNVTSGYRLAMERLIKRMPEQKDLKENFVPGVSFHFKYEDLLKHKDFVFDGYHPAKIKDAVNLNELMFACVVPKQQQLLFEKLVPENIKNRVFYLKYDNDGLIQWNKKVYHFVCNIID